MVTPRKDPKDLLQVGRPTKYKPEYCEEIVNFFSGEPYREVEVNMPSKDGFYTKTELKANDLVTFSGFARSIDVAYDTVVEWCKVHPEFSAAYKKCKELQKDFLMANGLQGLYSTPFAIFTAKNITDWRDQKYVEQDIKQEIKATVSSVSIDDRLKDL